MSRTKAEKVYDRFNRKYFAGRLPRVPVRFSLRSFPRYHPLRDEAYAQCKRGKPMAVFINPRFLGLGIPGFYRALLHEMVHIKLGEKAQHGPRFQKEMRRLAALGAFDGYW